MATHLQYSCQEKSHGQRSLMGNSPRGHKELDTTEQFEISLDWTRKIWHFPLHTVFDGLIPDDDCSHEIKRCLLLGRKVMTNLDSILKSRAITLPTKVHLVKAMDFPVVIYGCESWTVKKAEHWRIDCFWTVVLEKTLESPLDCKEIQPVHSEDQSWKEWC